MSQKNKCLSEKYRWKGCSDGIMKLETPQQVIPHEPGHFPIELSKSIMECAWNITCKGELKLKQFMFTSEIFAMENLIGVTCAEKVIFSNKKINELCPPQQSGDFAICAKKLLERSQCNDEEKRALIRSYRARGDLLRITNSMTDMDRNNFDEYFDSTKYY